ncbi:hypothetical protein D3C73_1465950 [compost metagenome]
MIYIPLNTIRVTAPFKIEVLGNELPLLLVFIHNANLPGQEVCHELTLELRKFSTETTINRTYNRREVLPAINPVTPIVESKLFVKLVQGAELASHIFDEL